MNQPLSTARYSPVLHWLALLTAICTFPLIFMGGLVTSHQVGMSVPDWPNSFGYNMFLFPPSRWVGGIFYEHTHRLLGTLVGMLAIGLVIAAWSVEKRRWVRWLALAVLAGVIFQGVLGGLRVRWNNLELAMVHACVAQAFFALSGVMATVTSRWWLSGPRRAMPASAGRGVAGWLVAALVVIYLQLIVGAVMRHQQAGLAIPDFPLSYGRLVPPMKPTAAQWEAMQNVLIEKNLPLVTPGQIHLAYTHRLGALIVAVVLIIAAVKARRFSNGEPALSALAHGWMMLLVLQITLGAMTIWMKKPADIATLHVACGALIFLSGAVLLARTLRFASWAPLAAANPSPILAPLAPAAG